MICRDRIAIHTVGAKIVLYVAGVESTFNVVSYIEFMKNSTPYVTICVFLRLIRV